MLKKLFALFAMLYAAAAFAAVDVNTASEADLQTIKGIGPAMAGKIVQERKNGNFKDWADFQSRVKGVGAKSAAKMSENGLTVGGAAMPGSKGKKASASKDGKAAAPAPAKAAAPAPAQQAPAQLAPTAPAKTK